MLKFNNRFYKNFLKNNHFLRYYSQITLDRKKTIYTILKPYLDFEEKSENLVQLENNIKLRGLDIKLPPLISLWQHYKNVKNDLKNLEIERLLITKKIEQIKANGNDEDMMKSIKFTGINLREDMKMLKIVLNDLEEQLYPKILELPNELVENSTENVLFSKDVQKIDAVDHLKVGHELGILEYDSPKTYFLKDEAAIFELAVSNKLASMFINNNFILFSNPDFTRNTIVDCLKLKDVQSLLTLEKLRDDEDLDRLHLNGGASVLSFCCYHSQSVTKEASLPLQYVTKGRHYAQSQYPGLYGVWQNTAVQIFIGNEEEILDQQLSSTIKILTDFYTSFKIPLRVIHIQPNLLSNCEKMRISFQTYSVFYKQYIELGNISLYGDYISKRMRIYYSKNRKDIFMHIVSGTVLKIPPLLAALLEYKQDFNVNNF